MHSQGNRWALGGRRWRARSPAAVALWVGAVLVALSLAWVAQGEQQRLAMLQAQAQQAGGARAQALRQALEHSLGMLDALKALVQQGGGQVPEFDRIALPLLETRPEVLAVGLLPGGVVSQVVPPALQPSVQDMNVLVGPHAHPGAQRAWREHRLVLSPPEPLPIGGLGWVVHLPVKLLGPTHGGQDAPDGGAWWGLVRAAISLPRVIATAQLAELPQSGWSYALTQPADPTVVARSAGWDPGLCAGPPVVQPIALRDQVWVLSVCPTQGWTEPVGLAIRLTWALVFSAACALLVYLALLRMQFARGLLHNLTRHVPGGLYQYRRGADGQATFPYASPGLQAQTGLDRSVLRRTDATWWAQLLPPDSALLRQALADSAQRMLPLEVDFRMRLPSGDVRWFRTRAQPQAETGGAVLWSGYLADWTDEKTAEQALADSNRLLIEAQEVARLGHFVTDLVRDRWTGSSVLGDVLGFDSAVERTAREWMDMVEPEFRPLLRRRFREMLTEQRGSFALEYPVRRPSDGRVVWVQALGRVEFDGSGVPLRLVGTVQDITERKTAEADISRLAHFDSLTGMPNRRLFLDRLNAALAACVPGQTGAVLYVDLDNFKDLNDAMGHQVGDALLRLVAIRLLACAGESHTVARLGGDEFVVLVPALDPALEAGAGDTAQAAERLGQRLMAALVRPYALEGGLHTSTPSMGIALFGDDDLVADDVIKRADMAMYQAKAAGRNALRFFDPSMEVAVTERLQLVGDLRQAIAAGELCLHYQPQHNQLGHLVGAEALLRWTHPQRGAVSPGVFVPLAEQAGLMETLGQWVMHTACQQLHTWLNDPALSAIRPGAFSLAINVSAHQFRGTQCVQGMARLLGRWPLPTGMLKLELTESVMVQDVEDTIAKMNAIRALGVRFSLDDFGTGYSSLSQLKRLPLDQLKIDQTFVRDLLTDSNGDAIARTVVALGQTLGLEVIAEGVETQSQRDRLLAMGCLLYQGYWFSKPVDSAQFRAYALAAAQ